MDIVAYNIKRIIDEKGLKKKFVAEKSGFSEQDFSNMLNGRKRIHTDYIPLFCYALDTQPNDLFASCKKEEPIRRN